MIFSLTLNWPPVIEFGPGKFSVIPDHLAECRKVFILADMPFLNRAEELSETLNAKGIRSLISTDVVPEPPFEALERLPAQVKAFGPDAVIGIGGGSAMDLAKLVSVLFTGEQRPVDIIGTNQVNRRDVRLITVATTSGTGSEVTPIAVLTDTREKLKKGVVSRYLIPDVAIVDPELTVSMPPSITASTGMDAMTHCIEAYTNRYAHPIIDNIALEGIRWIGTHLERAVKNGNDLEARTAMSLGSLYGGMCLGPVNTAGVHALAYPLGGEFKISHGVSNSVLLPFVMVHNLPECVEKYAKIAEVIGVPGGSSPETAAKKAIRKIRDISNSCNIPPDLKSLNIPESAISAMAEAAMNVTRLLDNNPRVITLEDAERIYSNAWNGILE